MAPPNIDLIQPQAPVFSRKEFDAPTGPIDKKDIGTPDAFVSRDPMLTRLTGKHPLNAETPVSVLLNHGFITPNSVHIVRNHGPVPQNDFDTHTITIGGLVNKPVTITMKDLLEMPPQTMAVTICCAGNRRKEQNSIRPSIGFSWGAGGIGTAYWTGVFLRDVINKFAEGLKPEALHICMDGNDATAKGPYGTSLPVNRAMSEEYDVMIAYKMNGEPLPYDHGYPVRCIVPGCIGGRSVKWLSKIEATTHVSQNPYQDADNKVFPPTVLSAEQATAEKWWSIPEYSVYDLNINSVIASPFHGTKVPLTDLSSTLTLRGYAYGGGNRKITRCEITLDDGKTWRLATVEDGKEEADKYAAEHYGLDLSGKDPAYWNTRYWTWVHWSIEIPVVDLLGVKEICLKCWNDANNSQPKEPTWSLMGMLHNAWYRVRLHLVKEPELALVFQHPTTLPDDSTLQHNDLPGWLEEEKQEAAAPVAAAEKKINKDNTLKTFSLEEMAKHTTDDDCWLLYDGYVYDCTSFLKEHPGGAQSIILAAGSDCTDEFDAIHSQKAKDMLEQYRIGKIEQEPSKDAEEKPVAKPTTFVKNPTAVANEKLFFEPRSWKKLVLQNKEYLSATIRKFTFAVPDDVDQVLSLPVGLHVYMKLKQDINDTSAKPKMVIRAYTPSQVKTKTIEFVIKIYYPFNSVPGGRLTTALDQIRLGETVDFKGPLGEIQYFGKGDISLDGRRRHVKEISMIAGGTGITPMWQIIKALKDDQDEMPFVSLIYCARSLDDIIFYKELNELQTTYGPDHFRVRFILNEEPKGTEWDGGVGFLCAEEMKKSLFPFNKSTDSRITLLCGPEPMLEKCCKPILKDLFGEDYVKNNTFEF
ncbi:MAG: nitrate reductase [Benjaminiella poitrasii]|nr:MAG: nitrate reductase [Benjaminiella poitrasii]